MFLDGWRDCNGDLTRIRAENQIDPLSRQQVPVNSQTLIALENKGYLRRRRGLRDKRSVNLELTPAGDALLDRDPLRVVDEVVAGLPAGEKATISGGLSRLLRDVQRRLGGSEFGVCECCSLFSAEGAANEHDGPHRCGLTSEPVGLGEAHLICVNYQAAR